VKKIIIKKDSTGTKSSGTTHKASSDSTKTSAPTGEDRQGFDIGG